ncbi:sensor histidine kinase [Sphingomonas endolithica]|uniref:sensor histidine kinase n=1 Tax=Sphingomonas endolithica TaxID=2972485 RepID=UPI0021AFF3C6|nr:sensor histidine kinase [Sphingomonas sp. ZFBP2030]
MGWSKRAMVLAGVCSLAITTSPSWAEPIDGYKHTAWTVEDGAPASVRYLAQSSNGYLWIASGEGLFRFDGVTFERMPSLSGPELGEYEPSVVHAAPNGDVWVGYRPGAVAVYRKGRLYDLHMPNPPEFVTGIQDDGKGGLWIVSGRSYAALSHYRAGKWTIFGEAEGVRGQVNQLFLDRSGILWATQDGGLLYLKPGARRFVTSPARVAPGVFWVGQAPDGRRWLYDRRGLRPLPDYPNGAIDPATFTQGPDGGKLRRIRFDLAGNLWGTDAVGGLFQIPGAKLDDPAARTHPNFFTAADGLTSGGAAASLVDREGNIWVGTSRGLDRMRKAMVRPQAGLGPISPGYAGESDAGGTIYIEDDAGIHAIGPRGDVKLIAREAGNISAPCRRRDGSVVTMIPSALLQLRPEGGKVVGPAAKDPPFGCADDAWGRLWVWSAEDRLQWRDHAGWHTRPAPPEALTAGGLISSPWGVAFLRIGATGLMRLDPHRLTSVKATTLGVGAIYSVSEGDRDLLISGTRGLARIRGGAVRKIDGARFAWLTKLRSLTQTRSGDTWMQARGGIVRVKTADLDRAFEDRTAALRYDLFDSADGLSSSGQKNGLWGRQIFEGGDGIVRFLSDSGLIAIDPKEITRNVLPPPVVIGSLTSGPNKYFDPVAVDLPAGRTNITIGYAALSLSVPERVRFRYKLEGYDDDWVDPGKQREAVYGNLAPGRYRFMVIAANNDGVWNRKGASLLITVAPAFYHTIWFKALCLLLGVILLWWGYTIRVRHLTSRMQATLGVRLAERERIARELHDTLLQTFQGLVLQFQAAANRLAPGGAGRDALDRALLSADVALVEGRNRVRELRVDDAEGDLTEGWVALAAEPGPAHTARFELTVEGKPHALHPLVQEELKRLGEEALRNAYQHADASLIEVIVGYRATQLRLDIRDNGVGLPSDVAAIGKRSGHYGLVGMRERARRIGGLFSIVSGRGKGTEVLVTVPAKAAYLIPPRRSPLAFWR